MFDQAQGICKVNCLQGEAWLLSNSCIQCEIGCDSCENISAACQQEYEFMISESKDPDINYHYTFEFSIALSIRTRPVVFLSNKDFLNRKLRADSLELDVEDQTSRKQGPMTFAILDRGDKFAIAANITGFGTSWLAPKSSVDYKFTLKTRDSQTPLNITENYEINPYGGSQTERATNTEKIFVYKKGFSTQVFSKFSPLVVDKAKLESATGVGGAIGSFSSFAGSGTQLASVASVVFSVDPSGILLKFSQILKLFSRLRLVNISYGVYLEGFLDSIGDMFDKKYDKKSESTQKAASSRRSLQEKKFIDVEAAYKNGWKGKFEEKGIPMMLIARINQQQLFMFLGSWLLRIIFNIIFWQMRVKKYVKPWLLSLVRLQRKLHFIIFNSTVLDILFYGTRTILHSKQSSIPWVWILSVICFILAFIDVVNIGLICSRVVFEAVKKNNSIESKAKAAVGLELKPKNPAFEKAEIPRINQDESRANLDESSLNDSVSSTLEQRTQILDTLRRKTKSRSKGQMETKSG